MTPRETRHCSKCGRFVGNVRAVFGVSTGEWVGGPYLKDVVADCGQCGEQPVIRYYDGEEFGWGWDDFEWEEAA